MKTGGPNRYGDFKRHGMTDTPTYNSWVLMHKRCRNKNNPRYGGIGISVCERWISFTNFYEDMGERPTGMSIDRIETCKGYFKDNCRWANDDTQANNRSTSFIISLDGKILSASQWSRVSGIRKNTIIDRIRKGMLPRDAIFLKPAPPGNARRLAKISRPLGALRKT